MAEKVIAIKMTLDASETVSELGQVEQETASINEQLVGIEDGLRNLSKEAAKGEASKQFDKLNKVLEKNVLSIQDLGVAADNFKNIALAAGTTSPIGQQALKKAAEMEKEMDKLNQSVANLAEGGRGLNAAMQIGTGVVAGYTAFQGVTALLGEENEELQETLVKVQAAQSVLMGVQELKVALDRKGLIVTTAQAVANKALAISQRVLNAVMKANPIGLIITGVTLLVGAFVLFRKQIVSFISNWANLRTVLLALLGPIGWIILAYEKLFGAEAQLADARAIEAQKQKEREEEYAKQAQARLDAIKDERDASHAAHQDRQSQFDLEIERLDAVGKSSNDLKLQKLQDLQDELKAQVQFIIDSGQAWEDYYEKLRAERGQSREDFIAQMKGQGIDIEVLQAQQEGMISELEDKIFSSESKILAFKRNVRETDSAEYAKHQEELQKTLDDSIKKQLELEAKLDDLRVINIENQDKRELKLLKLKQQRERDALEEKFGLNGELEQQLLLKQSNELEALQDKVNERKLAAEKEFQALVLEGRVQAAEAEQAEIEARQEKIDATIENMQEGLEVANEINEILNEIGERRQAKIEETRDKNLSSLEKNKKAELSQEGLSANKRAQIEHKFAMAEFKIKKESALAADKIAKRSFNRNKALKLAEVAINTASGIAQALGSMPPPASFIMAGITGGLGVAQSALIASTKFTGTAGAITPPSFSVPTISAGGSGGGSGSGAGGDGAVGSQQNNVGTDPSNITGTISVSQVEINKERDILANVDEVSTV